MSAKFNYRRTQEGARAGERRERTSESQSLYRALHANEGELQRHMVQSLLANKHTPEEMRPTLEKWAEILSHGSSTLAWRAARRLHKLRILVAIRESGREDKRTPEQKEAQRRERERLYWLGLHRHKDLVAKNPRPAWMKDPSLLPKKPPGRS
jgi:hypothetical protein